MMDLLEYQAKELFRQMGIPVLPSQRIDQPGDLKGLKVPYPVVLKSQVYAGGRGKAGGIRFVENTIDAIAAAHTIFQLPIEGQRPAVILAEARYPVAREVYLAVTIDRSCRCPVLLGSAVGGIELESVIAQMQQVIVDQEFSPFYARRLAVLMGLTGELIQTVGQLIEKMYRLFIQKDLDLIEINPLGISPTGTLMALDGTIRINEEALGRHEDLAALNPNPSSEQQRQTAIAPLNSHLEGTIAILSNGLGLTLATLDLLQKAGGQPGNIINLGEEYNQQGDLTSLPLRLKQALNSIVQNRKLEVGLINILTTVTPCLPLAEVIKLYVQRRGYGESIPPLVVRLMGADQTATQTLLSRVNVPLLEHLEEAIAQAIVVSKERKQHRLRERQP